MAMRKGDTPKLPPDQEEAYLNNLKFKREQVARLKLQAEAQAVASKFRDLAIEKLAEDSKAIADKDRKNFGFEQEAAVAAITVNAVLLAASAASKEESAAGKGKGKSGYKPDKPEKKGAGGGKKGAAPKIGAKLEKLPPPTIDAGQAAIAEHKKTLVKVSKFNGGQLSLLRAFDAWMLLEINEPMRGDVPAYLKTFLDAALIDKETFTTYWAASKTALEVDGKEVEAAQVVSTAAFAEHADAAEKLKVAEAEMADVVQRLKWSETEMRNARCGNQPTGDEIQREKEAIANEGKLRTWKLSQTKVVEMCHKRQVSTLNARETADRSLSEKKEQMKPLVLIHQHACAFYEGLDGGAAPEKTESVPS